MNKYVSPSYEAKCFHCPVCGAYAQQIWTSILSDPTMHPQRRSLVESTIVETNEELVYLRLSQCAVCGKTAIWRNKTLIFPNISIAPLPSSDMPFDIAKDFNEARSVLNSSPRSSAALLRLSLQKLCKHLGQSGRDLDKDIGKLVQEKSLSPKVQKALDIVRVIGNNAVHPGEIDLDDDKSTALALFDLINLIIEEPITRPHQIEELYEKLPKGALEHIEKRDGKPSKPQQNF